MKKLKLLIVEDDRDTEKFFKLFLGKKFLLNVLNSDKPIIDNLEKHDYNLIIIDVSIKNQEKGSRIIRELKKNNSINKIPIIYLSSFLEKTKEFRDEKKNVDVFLEKPVSNQTLLNNIIELTN